MDLIYRSMYGSNIQKFSTWRASDNKEIESMIGTSRQIAHLAGLNLDPKGRWKKEGNAAVAKFSVRPKPLKWKGIKGWERVIIMIKHDSNAASFVATIDGKPMNMGPKLQWQPVKRAADVIEKVCNKLKKEEPNDR